MTGKIDRIATEFPTCWDVGDLIRELQKLPAQLPLDCEGIQPVWFNIGKDDGMGMREHLGLEPGDDYEDEDDD